MNKDVEFISSVNSKPDYTDWLVDLIENDQVTAAELRSALATKFLQPMKSSASPGKSKPRGGFAVL